MAGFYWQGRPRQRHDLDDCESTFHPRHLLFVPDQGLLMSSFRIQSATPRNSI
jgi:hypothetical protein